MVSLNRMEKGKGSKCALDEITDLYGFPAKAIVTMKDVIEYLSQTPFDGKLIIDSTIKSALDSYYAQYGVGN